MVKMLVSFFLVTILAIGTPRPDSGTVAGPPGTNTAKVVPSQLTSAPHADPDPAHDPDTRAASDRGRARVQVSLDPPITWSGDAADGQERVDRALERFRAAGLRLPSVEIVFHADTGPCRGHDGLFRAGFDPWLLLVCSEAEFVLTHELAHAWEAANLDDVDRDAYLAHRGLGAWWGSDLEWEERGVEDAAFMLQQNLMMRPARPDSDRWIERSAAYEELTGLPSPVRSDRLRSPRRGPSPPRRPRQKSEDGGPRPSPASGSRVVRSDSVAGR